MTAPNPTVGAARAALKEVEGLAASLDMFSTGSEGVSKPLPTVGMRRRRLRAGEPDPISTVALVSNEEDVLLWREGGPSSAPAERRRLRGVPQGADGELVELYHFEKLEPNEINRFLTDFDGTLNTQAGLSRLVPKAPADGTPATPEQVPVTAAKGKKRRLLLMHGTFSKSQALLDGISKAPNGADFFRRVFAHYDEILLFDHPTLSVSPMLNAFDLSGLMATAGGPLDVVAHSRGGLVTRWFLEGFGAGMGQDPRRAVLIGSPLGGTSLASPPRLRNSLSMLSNFGTALMAGGAARLAYFPLLAAPLALLKVATSVVSAGAKTPLVDAAVSMVPGLAAQSRVGLNHELARVRGFKLARPPTYFVVQSNFETERAGWKFWRWFRADKLKDAGADAVFPGANDLVVDTPSMNEFAAVAGGASWAGVPAARQHDFRTSGVVHHTNYFEQQETLEFILDRLKVP